MRVLISLHRHSNVARGQRAHVARRGRHRISPLRYAAPSWLLHLIARLGLLPRASLGPP